MDKVLFLFMILCFLFIHAYLQEHWYHYPLLPFIVILLLPEIGLFLFCLYFQTFSFFLEVMFGFQFFLLIMNTILDLFYYKKHMYRKLRLKNLYLNAILLYLFASFGSSLEHTDVSFLPFDITSLIIVICFFLILLFLPKETKKQTKLPIKSFFILPIFFLYPLLLLWYGNSFFTLPMSYFLGMILALSHVFTLIANIERGEYEKHYHYFILEWGIHFLLIAILDIVTPTSIYLDNSGFLTNLSKLGLYSMILISYAIFNKKGKGLFYSLPSFIIMVLYCYFLMLG